MKNYNYKDHGFVILKNVINENLIKQLIDELNFCFSSKLKNFKNLNQAVLYLDKNDKDLLYHIIQTSSKLSVFNEITLKIKRNLKKVLEVDSPIFELDSSYLIGLPSSNRITYDFHQESNYWKDFKYDVITVHYPISKKLTKKNGSMSVLIGSHKLKTLNFKKPNIKAQHTTSLVPLKIDEYRKKFKEYTFVLKRGDCAFFHKDLIHRSNLNLTDKIRIAGITRIAQELKI